MTRWRVSKVIKGFSIFRVRPETSFKCFFKIIIMAFLLDRDWKENLPLHLGRLFTCVQFMPDELQGPK